MFNNRDAVDVFLIAENKQQLEEMLFELDEILRCCRSKLPLKIIYRNLETSILIIFVLFNVTHFIYQEKIQLLVTVCLFA